MKCKVKNPILPGFNPDPSITRAGNDYYIATSTFEWYPGVQIHHSTNLRDWKLITRPLSRKSQLDMRGNPDSCGVWAPCLSYADGMFWLVYSDVKRFNGSFLDVTNYIVYTEDICGEWSEPIRINSGGFDASLFHDDDGRKYFLNMQWDHLSGENTFKGILMQEFSLEERRLIGDSKLIFRGTELKVTEAPHLYKRNGLYYLITAEGGTSRNHAMTMARSENIWGKYELHPNKYLVTTKDAPDNYLQKCGHGDFIEAEDGSTYAVFLCGRPMTSNNKCVLGRETSIAKVEWKDDGWLYLENGTQIPDTEMECEVTDVDCIKETTKEYIYEFDCKELPIDFQWLRTPEPERIFSLTEREGYLRLTGRESIGSWFEQALVARRQVDFSYTATTNIEYTADSFQQYAGLVCYYNRSKFHYLTVTNDDVMGKVLQVISSLGDYITDKMTFSEKISIPDDAEIELKADVDNDNLVFSYRIKGSMWKKVGGTLDMTLVSDEGGRGEHSSFTGAFVGMACSDLTGSGKSADFSRFTYIGR